MEVRILLCSYWYHWRSVSLDGQYKCTVVCVVLICYKSWEGLSLPTHQTPMLEDCMPVRPPSQSVSICWVERKLKTQYFLQTGPLIWILTATSEPDRLDSLSQITFLVPFTKNIIPPWTDLHLQPISLTQIAGWLIDGSTGRLTEWQSSSAFALLSPPQFLCPAVSIPLNTPSYRLQIKAALIWISSV